MFNVAAALVLGGMTLGCGAQPERVSGTALALGNALRQDIAAINGHYQGCTDRTGGWSVGVGSWSLGEVAALPGAPSLFAALEVVKNDSACQLVIDELIVLDEQGAPSRMRPAADITLSGGYQEDASLFAGDDQNDSRDPSDPGRFYGNARLSATDFAAAFSIQLLVTEDPNLNRDDAVASYTLVTSSATVSELPSPDYTADLSETAFQTDAADKVTQIGGDVVLGVGSFTGQKYVVHDGDLAAASYDTIRAAFEAGSPASLPSAVEGEVTLDAQGTFSALVNKDLTSAPAVLSLIIENYDAESDLHSYQVFAISFHKFGDAP
jgi:hypothetical protein